MRGPHEIADPPGGEEGRNLRVRALKLALGSAAALLFMGGAAAAEPPGAPEITEPAVEGQLVHPADVHMEAAGFSDPDDDSHVCSDWEIRRAAEVVWEAPCAGGLESVHIHLGDGSFVNSYAGRTELEFDAAYTLHVRYRDSADEVSAWAQRSFRTYPPSSPGGSVAWTPVQPNFVVEQVAGGLQLPVNVAFVPDPGSGPDDPLLYVTELYGTIKVVTRDGGVADYASNLLNFNPTGDFPGSGEQGLTGIVVEPATGDVFASLLYDAAPPNGPHYPRVVRFHSNDGGLTAAGQTTVLDMVGETQGQSHQVSNLTIGPDGKLYVHMGDGFNAARAQDLTSFRGKILRLNLGGTAPSDNPFYDAGNGITATDYVFAYGFRNPFGGDWRAANGVHYEVENGPFLDRLARIDEGINYLWDGSNASMGNLALYRWEPSHAPVNIAFVQPQTFSGSGFPASKWDHAFVTESGPTYATGPQVFGKRIVEFAPDPLTGEIDDHPRGLVEYTGTGKATAAGLAAGPDGLYFTDLYKDLNYTSPIDPGARLLRVRYAPAQASPPGGGPTAAPAADPRNDFSFVGLRRDRKRGIAFLFVELPGPGGIELTGRGLKEVRVGPAAAAPSGLGSSGYRVKLKVQPAESGDEADRLRRSLRRRGKATVEAVVTYQPSGGTPSTRDRKVKLLRR
jgi:glucose/arabinose dehydrogenase